MKRISSPSYLIHSFAPHHGQNEIPMMDEPPSWIIKPYSLFVLSNKIRLSGQSNGSL